MIWVWFDRKIWKNWWFLNIRKLRWAKTDLFFLTFYGSGVQNILVFDDSIGKNWKNILVSQDPMYQNCKNLLVFDDREVEKWWPLERNRGGSDAVRTVSATWEAVGPYIDSNNVQGWVESRHAPRAQGTVTDYYQISSFHNTTASIRKGFLRSSRRMASHSQLISNMCHIQSLNGHTYYQILSFHNTAASIRKNVLRSSRTLPCHSFTVDPGLIQDQVRVDPRSS